MLFNSIEFLFFFPIVTFVYFILQQKWQWAWLVLASCVFYMVAQPEYICVIFLTIIVDYFAAIEIAKSEGRKRKLFLIASIVVNISILGLFKYNIMLYNFWKETLYKFDLQPTVMTYHWAIPLGLSFHTFQAMAYTIEVYRGHQKPERHFGIYSLYVLFYPQMVAGPIERPQNMIHQFWEKHRFDYQLFVEGLRLMAWGLFKKVVVADRLVAFVAIVNHSPEDFNGLGHVISSILFSLQIYCDFSGYSDIAMGAAGVMGFKLMVNFKFPYFSRNISSFWRHWHISLSTWFKDYVYIPLGGSRNGRFKLYRNLLIVFLLSGLWHGNTPNFFIWGGLHGLFQILGDVCKPLKAKANKLLNLNLNSIWVKIYDILFVNILVTFAWIFFRSTSYFSTEKIISGLTKGWDTVLVDIKNIDFVKKNVFLMQDTSDVKKAIIVSVLVILIDVFLYKKSLNERLNAMSKPVRWTFYYLFVVAFLYLGVFEKPAEFIYFQF